MGVNELFAFEIKGRHGSLTMYKSNCLNGQQLLLSSGRLAAVYYRLAGQNQSQSGVATKTNYKDAGSPIKSGMTEKDKKRRYWLPTFARMTEKEEADSFLRQAQDRR